MTRRIKYPQHRKSPYKHNVRSHTRKNRPVKRYVRGAGKKPVVRRRPRKIIQHKQNNSFTARVEYTDYSSETLDVSGKSYVEALDKVILGLASTYRL